MTQQFPQVNKAVNELMNLIMNRNNERFYLLMAPMQSGKTQFIEDAFITIKEKFPQSMGLYVASHNHKDFIEQNFSRLEHLESIDFHCLTLSERRLSRIKKRPIGTFTNDPVFIFFDENHFGDGVEQTIDNWLRHNKLYPGKNVYLIGVSATPFSSIRRALNTTIIYDIELMPTYKSVTQMLNRGDIIEATPLIKKEKNKMMVFTQSEAYLTMENIINTKNDGYIILRIPKQAQAFFLEKELKNKFGRKIHVRNWNQDMQMSSPSDYFGAYRKNVVTIVIVQQKARMGNTIPTQFVHMVYDYCPTSPVATVAQGLLGRMCGHGKINHQVKVFSHLDQAKAYSLFENKKLDEFSDYLGENRLKASARSTLSVLDQEGVVTEVLSYSPSESNEDVKDKVRKFLANKYGPRPLFDGMIVRKLSKNIHEGSWYKKILKKGLSSPDCSKLLRDVNKVSVLIDDRFGHYKIYATFGVENSATKTELIAKPNSLYSII